MKKGSEPPVEKEGEEGYSHGGRKRRRVKRAMGGSAIGELAPVRLDKRPRSMKGKQPLDAPPSMPTASPGMIGKPSMTGAGMPMMAGGGRLTAGERQAMPKNEFALPGRGKGPKGAGAGAYPIDTEGRARSALSRGAQHATGSELETIKRKVHARYPDIDISE